MRNRLASALLALALVALAAQSASGHYMRRLVAGGGDRLVSVNMRNMLQAGDIDPEARSNLRAFPNVGPSQVRFVLFMPRTNTSEADIKVELQLGKTQLLEPRNLYSYSGQVRAQVVRGWGFTFYELPSLGMLRSTRMAIDPNATLEQRFIQVQAPPLLPYNSRVPIVIIAHSDVEVRARYWYAGAAITPVPQG